MSFSEILKILRTQSNMTQKALGEKLNLTVSTICDWEKQRSEPNLKQLISLASVFNVPTDFLLGITFEC